MSPTERWPFLKDLVRDLRRYYGDRLVSIVLFGSRARGDFRENSDFDLAVVLKDEPVRRYEEICAIGEFTYPLLLNRGISVQQVPLSASCFASTSDRLVRSLRRDGIVLTGAML